MKFLKSSVVVLTVGLLAGCQDLTVIDKNRPSLDASLSTATNIETTVRSAALYWLGGTAFGNSQNQSDIDDNGTLAPVIEGFNDNATFGGRAPTLPGTTVMHEPPRGEFDHVSDQFQVNKGIWQDAYAAIATCHDVRGAIVGGLKGDAFPQSDRSMYFCKLIMGFSHLYLGVLFDKAFEVTDDFLPRIDATLYNQHWYPHDSVVDFAKQMIHEGIAEALKAPTTSTPTTWINGVAYTNVDMAKVAYGYLARAEIWKAATPAQREDVTKGGLVDWNKVIAYVDSSLQSTWTVTTAETVAPAQFLGGPPYSNTLSNLQTMGPTFTAKGTSASRTYTNAAISIIGNSGSNNFYRMHHKALGPADTSGAYVTWLKTPIGDRTDTTYSSPDKRLPKGPCRVVNGTQQTFNQAGTDCVPRHVSTSTNANYIGNAITSADGAYFQLLNGNLSITFNSQPNNPWRRASYQFIRFGQTAGARRLPTSTSQGIIYTDFQPIMTSEEQNLMKAEAFMRLGRATEAIPLINATRTNTFKGNLPAITSVNGPSEPFPRCVPHAFANAEKCGDLWDALLWEKRMEQMGTDMFLNFADFRAFGLFDPGTPVYFPPSYRESGQLGLPYFTYGGRLPGSASGFGNQAAACPPATTAWQYIGCTDYTAVDRLPRPPQ